ncbi:MAG: recombinase family protein, partial [Gemmatales bacterium]|nr:recombinase family protein [Gemmatales bacterium]MDW8386711.1 recombinase family protein [Gemmatales bacterium]
LKRLLSDIEAGRIDCVVVYKVDRLSRSLLDFARMMETFEKHHVSFVSVTQQFDTATSMEGGWSLRYRQYSGIYKNLTQIDLLLDFVKTHRYTVSQQENHQDSDGRERIPRPRQQSPDAIRFRHLP